MTRIVRYRETGGPDVLRVEEEIVAPPGTGEVAIRIAAIGLNRADILVRSGLHPLQPLFPAPIGCEAAGVVEAVGAGVSGIAPGDTVSVIPRVTMDYGTCAERINVPARYVAPVPGGLDPIHAAALWMATLTAVGGLVGAGALSAGDAVLIPAASSSVGIAAIQVARMIGAVPIAVTRGRSKADRLRAAGAGDVIVGDEEDVVASVGRITAGAGVRLVFDPIGGPGVVRLAETLRAGGTYLIYGSLSFDPTPFPVMQAFARDIVMRTYALDPARQDLDSAKLMIAAGVERGDIRPVVAAVFPFARIADAYRAMETNAHVGKIVVTT